MKRPKPQDSVKFSYNFKMLKLNNYYFIKTWFRKRLDGPVTFITTEFFQFQEIDIFLYQTQILIRTLALLN